MTSTATVKSTRDYAVPPDTVVEASGVGEAFDLGVRAGKPVLIVLRVTEII